MSANGWKPQGKGVGVTFHGENGSLLIDGDGYTVYDLKGAQVEEVKTDPGAVTSQVGPAVRLDALHTINFLRRHPRQGRRCSRRSTAATSAR